ISSRLWQERFGGKPDVLGRTIEVVNQSPPRRMVNGRLEPDEVRKDYRIVGVMSPRFTGALPPQMNSETSIWIPFENHVDNASGEPFVVNMIMRGLGRSAPGARPEAIIGELSSKFQSELETALPLANMRFDVIEGLVFNVNVHRSTQRQLLLFLSGSVLLALVAAANVSLFLLARVPGRRRELGIRMSVGAPLKRIARQLATEAVVLVAASAVLGLVLSLWLAELLRGSAMLRNAQWRDVTLFDWRVLTLVGAFLLAGAVVVSLAPIAGLERLGIAGSSRQVAARATPAQRIAGTAQIAVAAMFGGTAIAFGWYLATLLLASPGYETRNLVAVQYSIPQEAIMALNTGGNIMDAFQAELARQREVISSIPGVRKVSLGTIGPAWTSYSSVGLPRPDNPSDRLDARLARVDSRFIDILGIKLLHGRALQDGEFVVMVNRTLAERVFGRENVVGELLSLPTGASFPIVGVIDDFSFDHPNADIPALALMSSGFVNTFGLALVETTLTPAQLRRGLDALVESGALEVELRDVRKLSDLRRELMAADIARSVLTIVTALLVVVLATSGFYGTQRYLVTAGRREYAIRASVGAGPRALGRLVLARGFVLGLPGLVLGTLLALIAVAWLRDEYLSRDVSPFLVTGAVAVVVTLLLLAASVGPARQARRTEPAPLLRED
ncbi:MAG: ABC transporter permease, partial [Gammaproteobacteria bacterium]